MQARTRFRHALQQDNTKTLDDAACARIEKLSAEERLRWAFDTFGSGLVLTTSFGVQSAVLLHMATQIDPDVPVVFIDTQYLFPETYQFADALKEKLSLNLKIYRADASAAWQEARHGKRWEKGAAAKREYNIENKVEPMDRAARELGVTAWISGLRREQGSTREDRPVAELQGKTVKVYPLIDWTSRDVYNYLQKHGLPYHPLFDKGYASVGDWHSTKPGATDEESRGAGSARECGLHDPAQRKKGIDYQI